MILTASNDYFKDIKIAEIIDEFDGPKIFTFYTKTDEYFLAYFCYEEEDKSTWLYFPTNQKNIDRLRSDQISIAHFFKISIVAFEVQLDNQNNVLSNHKMFFEDINNRYIPESDVFLEKPDTSITIKIKKEGISPFNIEENSLLKILSGFNKTIKKAMKLLKSDSSDRYGKASITPNFAMTSISHGSVEIKLRPIQGSELLYDGMQLVSDVINEKENCNGDYAFIIKKEINNIIPSARGKKLNFDSIEISGILGTHSQRNVDFSLTQDLKEQYTELINTNSQNMNTIVLRGVPEAFDIGNETIKLRNLEENSYFKTEVCCIFDSDELEENCHINLEDITKYILDEQKVEIIGEYMTGSNQINIIKIKPVYSLK